MVSKQRAVTRKDTVGTLAALGPVVKGQRRARGVASVVARSMTDVDVIVLGQFSTARAADAVAKTHSKPVITTPAAAVAEMRQRLALHPR